MPMARYSLYVLKVPLNTKKTNKHVNNDNNIQILQHHTVVSSEALAGV